MYKRNAQGWSKHFDFMIIDIISLLIAYFISVYIRIGIWAYESSLYRMMGISLILVDVIVIMLNNTMHDVIKRGFFTELVSSIKHSFLVIALETVYLFATQSGDSYSRLVIFMLFFLHLLFGFYSRLLWKFIVRKTSFLRTNKSNLLVVVTPETAEEIINKLSGDSLADYMITGVVLTEPTESKVIAGYPIVADLDNASDYIVREWVDSVYIDAPLSDERVIKLMDDCSIMAVPTHYHVPNMSRNGTKRFSEKMGGTTVLTTSISYATPVQLFIKRCFDILAGLAGSLLALMIMAIVGPIIKKQSPGPILFAQERIGKNGKHFKMYKIRSMYMDAEERKKDLMDQNRIKDGMMFKLDFDPRIIGNKVLEDGTQKTGIGEFIRKTSLDEFPQFFNVLGGSMSTIGTRPPTIDEYEKYKYRHRARMSIKPGVTGMWQASGRSEITDFEEVVRLDTEYIMNWSPLLDLKLLVKTIGVVLSRKGSM